MGRKLNEPPKVFVSYSHRDGEWKDRLLRHLTVLEEQDLIELWEDRRIEAGGEWSREIEEAIEASNVAVLLVTANYLTSRFILDVEVPRLLQRREREGIQVFPILVKACCWDRVDWLARLNLRPRGAKPLGIEDERQVDLMLSELSAEIVDSCRRPEPPRAKLAAASGVASPLAPAPAPAPAPPPVAAQPPPTAAVPAPAAAEPALPAAAASESILVLPFADLSGGRDLEYLCDGVVDELINALTRVQGLRVASQVSTFQFRSADVDLAEIRRRMGVGAVLQGSVRSDGERLRISVRMVHLDGGFNAWSQRFDGSQGDVFALQDEVATGVAKALQELRGEPDGEVRRRRETDDAEVYHLYLQGRHHWNRRTEASLGKSLECFRRAIAREPGYASAHAGLALAYITLSSYGGMAPRKAMPAARTAATRALELDPGLAVVHSCLGVIGAHYDGDWETAEPEFRRAVEMSPGDPAARHWYAVHFLIPSGRFDEAGRELDKVLELDPLSLVAGASVGIRLYYMSRFEEAVERLDEVLDLEPSFPMARRFLGESLTELGRCAEAVAQLERASEGAGRGSRDPGGPGLCPRSLGGRRRRPRDPRRALRSRGPALRLTEPARPGPDRAGGAAGGRGPPRGGRRGARLRPRLAPPAPGLCPAQG